MTAESCEKCQPSDIHKKALASQIILEATRNLEWQSKMKNEKLANSERWIYSSSRMLEAKRAEEEKRRIIDRQNEENKRKRTISSACFHFILHVVGCVHSIPNSVFIT